MRQLDREGAHDRGKLKGRKIRCRISPYTMRRFRMKKQSQVNDLQSKEPVKVKGGFTYQGK